MPVTGTQMPQMQAGVAISLAEGEPPSAGAGVMFL